MTVTKRSAGHIAALAVLAVAGAGLLLAQGCNSGVANILGGNDGGPAPACSGGTDKDGDGYGPGCPAGDDCDDNNASINPGAAEACDGKDNNCNGKVDEGVTNACGTCGAKCASVGKGVPFPSSPQDPNVRDSKGVVPDGNGGLTLGVGQTNFNYMWIANTYDMAGKTACRDKPSNPSRCRGTVSKVDTVQMREVARYFTLTCKSLPDQKGCVDVNGKAINRDHNHTPSRTAVDYNFDVWIANRNVHGGQPSATKIANSKSDCVDRNKNGKIDTSADHNGDGKITLDCNGDGQPDNGSTVCTGAFAGKPPEFYGDDDECILFTVNYADPGDLGRSICLDGGKANIGAGNAWVGTFSRETNKRGNNKFYKINGTTGKIELQVELPQGHKSYGCMADGEGYIWSTDIYGSLTYIQARTPNGVGPLMRAPWYPKQGATYHHYGITVDVDGHVWLGGYHAWWVLRYKPNRSSFATMSKGKWSRFDIPNGFVTRGIAVDNRDKVWVAIQDGGYVLRIDRKLPDGVHDLRNTKNYWKMASETIIGVGVDFDGHIWSVGHKNDLASRLDIDTAGNPIQPATGMNKTVKIGRNPYTYSDFTGFGLINFVRPQGRYVYRMEGCPGAKTNWIEARWNATKPPGTNVAVRVRTGDSDATMGAWSDPFTSSPARFTAAAPQPNPARYLEVEVILSTQDKSKKPTLHDFAVAYDCTVRPD